MMSRNKGFYIRLVLKLLIKNLVYNYRVQLSACRAFHNAQSSGATPRNSNYTKKMLPQTRFLNSCYH